MKLNASLIESFCLKKNLLENLIEINLTNTTGLETNHYEYILEELDKLNTIKPWSFKIPPFKIVFLINWLKVKYGLKLFDLISLIV